MLCYKHNIFSCFTLKGKTVRKARLAASKAHRTEHVSIKFDTDAAEEITHPHYNVLPRIQRFVSCLTERTECELHTLVVKCANACSFP